MEPKELFMEKIEALVRKKRLRSILDLGSGQSRNFIPVLKRHPHLSYTGVELNQKDAAIARQVLKPFRNARVLNQPAYAPVGSTGAFDLCLSLSVLEHIKHLEKFLTNSINAVKKGGYIIHRYDLGHALYPASLREKLHVFIGNHLPGLLPESRFVCYLDEKRVRGLLEANGAKVFNITYHQMPGHKKFLKLFKDGSAEKRTLTKALLEWEFRVSQYLHELPQTEREKLFPAVCVWAKRR